MLHGWRLHTDVGRDARAARRPSAVESFRRLTRDLYIAPGEVSFWQGAFRDPADPEFERVRAALAAPRRVALEILYGDHEVGRRGISLFSLTPREDGSWILSVARHWNVDGDDPR